MLATLAFTICFSAWGMIAPLAPKIEDDLGLTDTQTAILIAMPVVLGALLRIPVGAAVDRFRGRAVFGALLLCATVVSLLVGLSSSYGMLLLAAFLLGVTGSAFVVGIPFVAQWFPEERHGLVLGIYGIGNIGTAFAAFLVPYIYVHSGQMAAALLIAAVAAAGAVVWFAFARNAPVRQPSTPVRYREVLGYGVQMWRLALFYFVTFGGFVALAIFLPKLLTDWFDLSMTDAGLRAAGFTVVATLSRPVGGFLADRLGGTRVLTVAFVGVGLDAMGLAWQAPDPSMIPVTVMCLSMAMFFGAGNGAVFKLVPQLFPRGTGAVTGIVGAAGGLGGFFPPLVMGLVKEATGDYAMAFVFLVAFAWLCAGQVSALASSDELSRE